MVKEKRRAGWEARSKLDWEKKVKQREVERIFGSYQIGILIFLDMQVIYLCCGS